MGDPSMFLIDNSYGKIFGTFDFNFVLLNENKNEVTNIRIIIYKYFIDQLFEFNDSVRIFIHKYLKLSFIS